MKSIFTAFLLFLGLAITAQHHFCAFDELMKFQQERNPEFQVSQNNLLRDASQGTVNRTEVYRIPVVFHVVWNEDSQNVPDEVIESQIEVLNEDFRRLNANADQTREIFLPFAADAQIEFYLAEVDPEGNPTNGITRTFTDRENFELDLFSEANTLDEVKFTATGGIEAWDTEHYMNIWVCNIYSIFGQIFGLAYPPDNLDNWPDDFQETADVSGVIVHYTTIGRNNPAADEDGVDLNNSGRALVHETGHYLGLRHIWGDGFFNGCSVDDGVEDTPNAAEQGNYTCNFDANTCDDGEGDLPDNVENYMDYNQDECWNMFTVGQVSLMRWVLENRREGLLDEQIVGVPSAESFEWSVFPNPITENKLRIIQGATSNASLTIFDASGHQLENLVLSPGSHEVLLPDYPAGMYFVQLINESNNSIYSKKVIIQ